MPWTGGNGKGLMGFAGHQNTLAALLLFTMPAGLWGVIKEVKEKVKQGKKVKVEGEVKKSRIKILFYIILTAVNALLLILTYSRASIAGLLIALAIYVTFIYRWKAIVVIVSGTVLIGGIIYLNPFIKKEASKIILKDFPNLLFSREILVEPSLKAAEHGGLIGLGYGVSDPNILVPGTGSHYENGRYVREKGNSILGLIEESGVIGLILFLIPSGLLIYYMINSIRKAGKDRAGYDHSLLTRTYEIADEQTKTDLRVIAFTFAFMIAFTFHAQFEAWWVGVGSTQMPLFFAYVGLAIGVLNQDKR